LLIIKFVSY